MVTTGTVTSMIPLGTTSITTLHPTVQPPLTKTGRPVPTTVPIAPGTKGITTPTVIVQRPESGIVQHTDCSVIFCVLPNPFQPEKLAISTPAATGKTGQL
uniref:Uncharacterized protein n=1 Tax=Grammatophora oceanica TaxID=210454 RepID=A0A7S1VAY1_9STRA